MVCSISPIILNNKKKIMGIFWTYHTQNLSGRNVFPETFPPDTKLSTILLCRQKCYRNENKKYYIITLQKRIPDISKTDFFLIFQTCVNSDNSPEQMDFPRVFLPNPETSGGVRW